MMTKNYIPSFGKCLAVASLVLCSGFALAGTSKFGHLIRIGSNLMVVGQASVSGDQIQSEIDAAIAAGAPSYTLPGTVILLNSSLRIPPGTKNFEIVGQNGTQLRRAGTADFSLIEIGQGHPYAFENTQFNLLPSVNIQPAVEGTSTLTVSNASDITTGYYAVIGTDPVNDVVRHSNGVLTYYYKRELVKVVGKLGNQVYLAQPIGRAFQQAKLVEMERDDAPPADRKVCENITIRNMYLNGRSAANNAVTQKLFRATLTTNLRVDDVTAAGFNNAAFSVMFCRGVSINNIRVSDGNQTTLGYGVEFAASRFMTVRNSTFRNHRWGVAFTSGNMDALVEDCVYTEGNNGGFDCGHGTGDTRVTYRRTVGKTFSIGNPAFMRGVSNILLDNCTATGTIDIFGNTSNIVIQGMAPGQTYTTRLIQLFAESAQNSIPSGYNYPISVYLRNGVTERAELDGTNIQMGSVTRSPLGLGLLVADNWTFRNLVPTQGSAVILRSTSVPATVRFTNCSFSNVYRWGSPLTFSNAPSTAPWTIQLENNRFFGNYEYPIRLGQGISGELNQSGNTYNSSTLQDSMVEGLSTMNGVIN